MPAQIQLKASLTVKGSFKIGPNPQPSNHFDVAITNQGDPLKLTPNKCLYLKGRLGSCKEALFLDEADAQKLSRQMQEYLYRQHWGILTPCRTGFDALNPRIIGWSGENLAQFNGPRFLARFWTADGK